MEPCLFCRLAEGQGERSLIYEDEVCYVILTIGPVTPGLVADWSNHPPRGELDAVAGQIRAA